MTKRFSPKQALINDARVLLAGTGWDRRTISRECIQLIKEGVAHDPRIAHYFNGLGNLAASDLHGEMVKVGLEVA